MNFIKTLAKGSKEPEVTSKPEKEQKTVKVEKATASQAAALSPAESKDQDPNTKDSTSTFSKIFRQKSLKDTQPTAATPAPEVDAAKANKTAPPAEAAESKGKAPAKNSKNETPKVTADPQTAASKQKDSAFSRLFRTKADPSKAKTLEAGAQAGKPAKQDEKKQEKTSLTSCFKSTGSKQQ